MFLKILAELDWPPIFLISPEQFTHIEGTTLKGSDGIASTSYPTITIKRGLRGKVKSNVIYHELAHHLFPSRPHWWVDNFGEVMARGGGRGYWAKKYNKYLEDMPTRSRLLKLARRASRRMKRK